MKTKSSPPRPARLFAEPKKPSDAFFAQIDGAARGNPGPAAYGVVIRRPDGSVAAQLSKPLGRKTNNEAEYCALIAALDWAASQGVAKLRVESDSELVVRQVRGLYKVKDAKLKPLHERAGKLSRALAYFSIEHVPRRENAEADRLANRALDGASVETAFRRAGSAPATAAAGLKAGATEKRVRARYAQGVLHPSDPLGLEEGEEVEITVKRIATETQRF